MSTFGGHLNNDRYPYISLDRFDGGNLQSTIYWLSHAHSDHMIGLEAKQYFDYLGSSPSIKLFCTEVTQRLLSCMSRYQHLVPLITVLRVDEPTLVDVPSISDSETKQVEQVTLTAIPAGHCPGSAMLLIEGSEGTVLYTGDFRLDKGAASQLASLHDSYGQVKVIDAVHCDTTFLSHRAFSLASRSECEEAVVKEVRDHISKGDNYHVMLKTKAKLGYENVYRVLYDSLGVKTHIQKQDGYLYSKIPSILETVTPDAHTQVHACSRHIILDDHSAPKLDSECSKLLHPGARIKVIQLSTLWFVHQEKQQKETVVQVSPSTVRCCYSFHSSYAEIADLIKYLKPKEVYPNVVAIRQSIAKTADMLNELLTPDEPGSQELSPKPEVDSWQAITDVKAWWLEDKKRKTEAVVETPQSKKTKQDILNESFSTRSRESSPELDLWSDSDNDDDGKEECKPDNAVLCCDSETEEST